MTRQILFVSSNFPPVIGGSAVVYNEICRRLSNHVVALGSKTSLTGEELMSLRTDDQTRGYKIHRLPCLQPVQGTAKKSKFRAFVERITVDLPIMARTLLCVTGLLLRYRVRVVCLGELVGTGWLVFPVRYLLRRRVIVYTHGEEVTEDSDWKLARMRGFFLRHAHDIVSVSRFCKGQIVARFGVRADRIHVINNGVDLDFYRPGPRDRSGLPVAARDSRLILSVGRFIERKGHEQLLRAMPAILEKIPDAYCLIVGDGPLREQLRTLILTLGLQARCTILVGVKPDDLRQLYRDCDVFALPCRTLADGNTEGFGLVFLEANACGAPVIAGVAGGTIEAVDDGESGLLVDGSDPACIADAVTRVLSTKNLAQRLASHGLRWASGFTWQTAAAAFLNICSNRQVGAVHAYPVVARGYDSPTAARHGETPALLVTIDVDEESPQNTFRRDGYRVRGVEALEKFHQMCIGLGVKPVYMLSYPVMSDREYVRLFREIAGTDDAELGIHLHSWVTPPFWEEPNNFTSYQCNLPAHIERTKLTLLVRHFEDTFGCRPMAHRAGRWGGSARTADLLASLGVHLDFSPLARYADPCGVGPDFTNLDGHPFWSGSRRDVLTVPACAVLGRQHTAPSRIGSRQSGSPLDAGPFEDLATVGTLIPFCAEAESTEGLHAAAQEIRKQKLPVAVFSMQNTSLYAHGSLEVEAERRAERMGTETIDFLRQCISERLFVPCRALEIHALFSAGRCAADGPGQPLSAA